MITAAQGYLPFHLIQANHASTALLAIIIYLFTQTLIIFFFTGTGVNIRDYIKENHGNKELHERSKAIKYKLFSPILLNILGFMIIFIVGGAVHTRGFPGWIHGLLFWGFIIHYIRILIIEHNCFKENTNIILEMTGIKKQSLAK
jgi:hypothetical protein